MIDDKNLMEAGYLNYPVSCINCGNIYFPVKHLNVTENFRLSPINGNNFCCKKCKRDYYQNYL